MGGEKMCQKKIGWAKSFVAHIKSKQPSGKSSRNERKKKKENRIPDAGNAKRRNHFLFFSY